MQKLDLKNMTSNYTRVFFMEKNDPNLPDFKGKKSKLPDFYHKLFPVGSKECRKILVFFFLLLSFLVLAKSG